jgi:hypothetical protein
MSTPSEHKSLFDHLNEIYIGKSKDYFDDITDEDKKSYSIYMINRFLSMNIHYAPFVNEIQRFNLTPESHYNLCRAFIPKGKQYNKYMSSKGEAAYPDWMVDIISRYYEVSKTEATEYIRLYYKINKEELRKICTMHGTEPKLLKKANL